MLSSPNSLTTRLSTAKYEDFGNALSSSGPWLAVGSLVMAGTLPPSGALHPQPGRSSAVVAPAEADPAVPVAVDFETAKIGYRVLAVAEHLDRLPVLVGLG